VRRPLTIQGEAEREALMEALRAELARQEEAMALWPENAVEAGALVSAEAGELTKATLLYQNESDTQGLLEERAALMRAAALRTAATCLRVALGLKGYQPW
jgi:hypothetical protein